MHRASTVQLETQSCPSWREAAKGLGRWGCYRSGTLRCKIRDERISNSWCLEDWGTFRDSELWFFKNAFWGILLQKSDHRSITNGKPTSLYRTGGNWNCASVVPTDAIVYPSQLNFWKLYISIMKRESSLQLRTMKEILIYQTISTQPVLCSTVVDVRQIFQR
jgi:hypothetical protein